MTMRHWGGRERGLAEQVLRMFTKRWVAVAAVLLVAGVATVLGSSATTHSSPAEVAVERAASLQPSRAGGGAKSAASLKHRKAVRGRLPKVVKRSHPRALRLHAAHGKVFDVRKLKSVVVRKERPERTAPGFAPAGSPAAEALENPTRTAPQLPKVIKKSQMVAAAGAGPDASFDGLDFATWGAGHPPDTNGDVGPNYYIQTVNTSIGIYDKSTGTRVAAFTFNTLHEPGALREPLRHRQLRRPGRPLRHLRGPLGHHRLRLQARRLGQRVNPQHVFQCFAVSKTGDPVNGGWNFYSIDAPGGLGDYPKFGVWPDGIYMSANMFGYARERVVPGLPRVGAEQAADVRRRAEPAGRRLRRRPSDFTVIPANARLQAGTPPAGSPEYFVSTEQFLNALSIYKFHVDWDKISTSTFTGPQIQTAPNVLAQLVGPRTRPRRRTPPTRSRSARWRRPSTRTSAAPSRSGSPTPSTAVSSPPRPAAARTPTTRPCAGTRPTSPAAPSPRTSCRARPTTRRARTRSSASCRRSRSTAVGDLAIGYTKSNATTNPQIKYAGRLAGDPGQHARPGRADADRRHRRPERQLRRLGVRPLGRLQRHGARPERLRVLDDGRVLRHERPQRPDPDRLVPLPGLHARSATARSRAPSPTARTRSRGRPSRSAAGRRPRTAAAQYSFSVPAGTYPTLTASKAGFDPASASTIAVPDGGTATRNFTLNAAAQSGCFTDNTQSAFQRGVPSNCDLVKSPGNVVLANPDNTAAQNTTVSPTGFALHEHELGRPDVHADGDRPAQAGRRRAVLLGCTANSRTSRSRSGARRARRRCRRAPTSRTATLAGFNDGGAGGLKTFTFATPVDAHRGHAVRVRLPARRGSGSGEHVAYTCSCATTGFSDSNPYASGQRVTSANSGSTLGGGHDRRRARPQLRHVHQPRLRVAPARSSRR